MPAMWSITAKLIVIAVVATMLAVKARSLCQGRSPAAGICAMEMKLWDEGQPDR
jgi:hypothetical protein